MTRVPGISEQIPVKPTPKQGSNITLQLPKTNRLSIWVINKNTTDENSNFFHKSKKKNCIVPVTLMTGWLI
jgi:hypothetical protein